MLQRHTFIDVLQSWAALNPERPALTFLEDGELQTRQMSYESLNRRAREVAAGIRKTVRAGDHVLLLHPPGLEFVVAFFGCLYAGVVPVPAYPPRNPRHFPRIESIIADAGARCVLTETDFQGRLSSWLDQRGGTIPVICTDVLHEDPRQWVRPAEVTPDTLAFLQYTSGSTGDPKGVMITHGNVMSNQRMIQEAFGHSEGLVQVSWLPVYHDMGLIGNLMQPLFLGGHCIFMSPVAFLQKPRRWLAAISRYHAQGSGGPNFALRLCTQSITDEQKAGLDLSSLKVFFVGSEPISAAVLEEFTAAFSQTGFRREAFYCCYGMAETTLLATGSTPGAGPIFETVDADALASNVAKPGDSGSAGSRVLVGCGKAAHGQELVIVDPETGVRKADGQIGEIWLRGANVARGYWRKPEITAALFAAQLGNEAGYLRTGDLGFLRNRELFVTGRMKDLIIIHGRNHYPQDIENTVDSSHAALSQNACAAVAIESGGEESLAIVVELQRSMLRSFDADEVFGQIRRAVFEQHELPVHAIVLIRPATLPRTSSGKVQRSECRRRFLAGSLEAAAAWSDSLSDQNASQPTALGRPSRITSAKIATWLQNWLGARFGLEPSRIDPDLAFADLGLDSVNAVALANDLSQWLGLDVAPTLAWDVHTIRLASKHLARQLNAPTADLKGTGRSENPMAESHQDSGLSLEDSAKMLALELASLPESDQAGTRPTAAYASSAKEERV